MDRHRGTKLRTEALPYGVRKVIVGEEEQQEWSSSPDRQNPDLSCIKEEQEELWIGRKGELEQADIKFTFTPIPVKSEQTEQMKTESEGDDYGASEADGSLCKDRLLKSVMVYKSSKMTVAEIEVSCDSEEPQTRYSPDEPPFSCPECGKRFAMKGFLKTHMRVHIGDKPHRLEKRVRNKRLASHSRVERHMSIGAPASVTSVSFEQEISGSTKTGRRGPDWNKTWDHKSPSDKTEDNHWNTGKDNFVSTDRVKEFVHGRNLARHMMNHIGENLLTCPECDKTFVYWSHFVSHMRSHIGEKPFRCYCGEAFAKRSHLTDHMRDHTGEKTSDCPICNKGFVRSSYLQAHMRSHTGERPYTCPVCKQGFSTSTNLKTHRRTCRGPRVTRKSQPVSNEETSDSCDDETTTSDSTGTDEETSDSSNTDEETSDSCNTDEETSDSSNTDRETSDSSETDEETSDSSKTDEETSDSDSSDSDETSDFLEIDASPKDWNMTQESELASHKTKNSRYRAKKVSSCPEFGEEFAHSRSVLRNKMGHERGRPFTCSVRSKTFLQKAHMQKRMRIHKEEKDVNRPVKDDGPFICPQCGTKVAHSRNVKRHLMIHQAKPLNCPACRKSFSRIAHLNRHMKVHGKSRQFTCDNCGESFTCLNLLKTHTCSKRLPLYQSRTEQVRTGDE